MLVLQFCGDSFDGVFGENASVPSPPTGTDAPRPDDIFDAMNGFVQPTGDFSDGWHRSGGIRHDYLSFTH